MTLQGTKRIVTHSLTRVSALTALSLLGVGCGSDTDSGIFATMTTSSLSSALLDGGNDLAMVTSTATCTTAPKSRCTATPTSYIMGYTKIELVTLASGATKTGSGNYLESAFDLTQSQSIYSGSVTEFSVPDATSGSSETLKGTDLSTVLTRNHDGVLITYAYVKQDLPSGVKDSTDTNTWSQYEICLQNGSCENSNALIGDYLVLGSTAFGFLEYAGCSGTSPNISCTSYSTPTARPAAIGSTDTAFKTGGVGAPGAVVVLPTSGDASAYKVFYPFDATTSISSSSKITIAFSIKDGFEWNEGVMKISPVISGQPQKTGGFGVDNITDTASAGFFNPLHDNAFLPKMPTAKISVE